MTGRQLPHSGHCAGLLRRPFLPQQPIQVQVRRAAGRIRALGQEAPRVWVITANDGGAAQGRI